MRPLHRLANNEAAIAKNKECVALYTRLGDLDPMHGKFYSKQIKQLQQLQNQ
jgi:hypothetical protein